MITFSLCLKIIIHLIITFIDIFDEFLIIYRKLFEIKICIFCLKLMFDIIIH